MVIFIKLTKYISIKNASPPRSNSDEMPQPFYRQRTTPSLKAQRARTNIIALSSFNLEKNLVKTLLKVGEHLLRRRLCGDVSEI